MRATYLAPRGRIGVRWERVGDQIEVHLDLPPGTSASLPFLGDGRRVGSGTHWFTIPVAVFEGSARRQIEPAS